MKIAILDAVPESYWKDDEGITDGEKFVDLLSTADPESEFTIFYVTRMEYPSTIDAFDGYLITGSPAGVHDKDDWIAHLSEFFLQIHEKQKPVVGSCFGHQLIAQTLGGEVARNEQGWLIGKYNLEILQQPDWMQPGREKTNLYHFNQDRVVKLPANATALVDSEIYPDFGYVVGTSVLSFQGHPEQPRRAMNNFIRASESILSPQDIALAQEKMSRGEPDSEIWGQWIMRFFEQCSCNQGRR